VDRGRWKSPLRGNVTDHYMIKFSSILSWLFLILGTILIIYGYITEGDAMYSVSLGKNINLIWGFVLFGIGIAFGAGSLLPQKD